MAEGAAHNPSAEALRIAVALAASPHAPEIVIERGALIGFAAGLSASEEREACIEALCRSKALRDQFLEVRERVIAVSSMPLGTEFEAADAEIAAALAARVSRRTRTAIGLAQLLRLSGLAAALGEAGTAIRDVLAEIRACWQRAATQPAFAAMRGTGSGGRPAVYPGVVPAVEARLGAEDSVRIELRFKPTEPEALAASAGRPVFVSLADATGDGVVLYTGAVVTEPILFDVPGLGSALKSDSIGDLADALVVEGEASQQVRSIVADVDPALGAGIEQVPLTITQGGEVRDGAVRFAVRIEPWIAPRLEGAILRLETGIGIVSQVLTTAPVARSGGEIELGFPVRDVPDGPLDTVAFVRARLVPSA